MQKPIINYHTVHITALKLKEIKIQKTEEQRTDFSMMLLVKVLCFIRKKQQQTTVTDSSTDRSVMCMEQVYKW